jgi:type I restriction enzyme, R subunit
MKRIVEQDIEDAALDILQNDLGYEYVYGPNIAPDGETPLRNKWDDVILADKLRDAISKLNPDLTDEAIEETIKKLKRLSSKQLIKNNEKFHKFLIEGVPIEFRNKKGVIKNEYVQLIDFKNPTNNQFLAVNQFTVIENNKNRRPDIIIFINGIPISIIELKNPADEKATIESAHKQLETYKDQISTIFNYNELLVISDGTYAQAGTLTSPKEWFLPWKTINGKEPAPKSLPQLQVLLEGMFKKEILTDLIKYFITFSKDRKQTTKILAGYHQYYATNKAITKTIKAIEGSRKAGVVWHTQGSGKSLTLAFYSGKLQQQEELNNPTIVIITDRNDLDDQLFNTFSSIECLREKPIQADNKKEETSLKTLLLKRSSGGIIFTTIHKFGNDKIKKGILSTRKNIIVAADEAHRTQYGFKAKVDKDSGETKYGFAKYLRDALPNASFIGFTGTPIDFEDKSTRAVFGGYIDVYDIEQAVEDKRTVRIYYESRLAKLDIKPSQIAHLDKEFDEVTEGEEQDKREKLKSDWARVEAIVGSDTRVKQIALDIVKHFEARQEAIEGKAMIVCMSRRICVELYDEIAKIKPKWVHKEDDKGLMKVIMTGSASDGPEWQKHIRDKKRRREIGENFKDSESEFKLAIVRDMWLTGFDVPSLNTLYIDKPMKGHGLMQAIARVNRVYKDKQGGLIVDYLGIAQELKKALSNYTKSGGKGKPTFDQSEAIAIMQEKYEIVIQFFHNFEYKKFFSGTSKEKMQIIPAAIEHVLMQKDGKKRYVREVVGLTKSYALAVPSEEAEKLRDEIGFFQAIKASIVKNTEVQGKQKTDTELNSAIKQIVSKAVSSEGVIDVFEVAGIKKPEISVLSDSFLEDVKGMKHKNLAFEALKKLLADQIRIRFKYNKIRNKKFSEMLEEAIRRYQNRSIDSAQVIQELIELAHKIRDDKSRGKELGLTPEEEAFYDALDDHDGAMEVLGEKVMKQIARELTELVRKNTSIDWTLRDTVQAKLRVMIKRLLRKYGYPPDKQKIAADLVLEQAKLFAEDWSVR